MDFRFVAYVNGILLLILSCALGFIGLTGLLPEGSGGPAFLGASATSLFFGTQLFFGNRGAWQEKISIRTGYLLTVSCWMTTALFSTLPLYYSTLGLSFTDVMFETVSALTTTGSTVLTGLDAMPHDILLWRSLLQWMGGIGIIVMVLAILPLLRIGGMNLFKSESSDISEKVISRLDYFLKVTVGIYSGLTVLCAILLRLGGMTWFDAVNHAMTTVSTGGFSTHDASIGHFNSSLIESIVILFMLAGSVPLVMYAHLLFTSRENFSLRRYTQVGGMFRIWAASIGIVALWNCVANDMPFLHALRVTAFNITSILSSTGYATDDYSKWGPLAVAFFFFLMFVGGCAGSTTGAVKVFRWQLLFRGLYNQFLRNLSPHRVVSVNYAGKTVDDRILHGVRNFLFLYILTFVAASLALGACGLDLVTSASGAAQAIGNMGPGLGDIIGPAGNFSSLPSAAKWIMAGTMILGRLELFTVYALLIPDFWRK